MTLNNIEALFKDLAERHKQINSFYNQQAFDITAVDEPTYPSLVINTNEIRLPKSANGYSIKRFSIDIQVIDLVHKDEGDKQEVLSDCDSILNDIVAEFSEHPSYNELGIDLIDDVILNPLRNAYGDEVSGWSTIITIETPHKVSWCGSPLSALDGVVVEPTSVIITDALNPDSPISLIEGSYTCTPSITPTGITYNRDYTTLQSTSYALYDDGWQLANGGYDDYTNLTNPLTTATLDLSTDVLGLTLKEDNEFGNKNRITLIDGTPDDNLSGYKIDHYYGIGWDDSYNPGSYDSFFGVGGLLEGINTASKHGFKDWMIPNTKLLSTIISEETSRRNLIGYNNTLAAHIMTSTTRQGSTVQLQYRSSQGYFFTIGKSYAGGLFIPCRIHYK